MKRKRHNQLRKRKQRLIKKMFFLTSVVLMGALIVTLVYWKNGKQDEDRMNAKITGENKIDLEKQSSRDDSETRVFTDVKITDFAGLYSSKADACRNYTVCLDAGHGGSDVGAEGTKGQYEKKETLQLAKLVKQYLESTGITVVMTRETDKTVSLEERRNVAENCGADLLLSIHRNVYEGSEDVNGIEAWINNTRPLDAVRISEKILQCVESEVPGVNNRGTKWGTMDNVNENYGVNKVSMESLILEVGFISSDYDNRLFEQYLEEYAKGIAKGILENIEET